MTLIADGRVSPSVSDLSGSSTPFRLTPSARPIILKMHLLDLDGSSDPSLMVEGLRKA